MTARVLIHVQHLLGTGHLRRAGAIARALAAAGMEVELVSGGPPIQVLDIGAARLVQLPPARAADASFKALIDEAGQPVDEAWRARRRDILLARFAALRPHVLITELYPFGRRMLAFELAPLLEAAQAAATRPMVLVSLRDILAAKSDPRRIEETLACVYRHYDRVLVHGDPALIELAASFPAAGCIADRLIYTGYVAGPEGSPALPGIGMDEIVVSCGGGAVGMRMLEAALGAAELLAATTGTWRLLLGPDLPADRRQRLLAARRNRVIIEPARADFPALLARARVSISQAGYNTAVDIIRVGARAVLVPFAGGGETEQAQRAAILEKRGWVQVVDENVLSPTRLAAAVTAAMAAPRPEADAVRLDGAEETARFVTLWLAERSVRA
ncbi:MAG: glycosyl transferase [Rhodospirillales bacterium]|nr:glycosyl transferase [Rhodospirillales bacterium]